MKQRRGDEEDSLEREGPGDAVAGDSGGPARAVVVGWIGKEEAGRLGMDPEGDFWSGGGRMGMGQAS